MSKRLLNALWGVGGQGANFLAMLVPMAFGRIHQITFVVVVAAAATIGSRVCVLAFPSLYPVADDAEADTAETAVAHVSVTVAVLGLVASLALWSPAPELARIVLWATLMTVPMTMYQVVNTKFVRRGAYRSYSMVRFVYGVVNLALVSMVSALSDATVALAATGVAAYVVGWAVGAWALGGSIIASATRGPVSASVGFIRRNATAIAGQTIDVIGSQTPALAVGQVGLATPTGQLWSGLQRIAGGVQTTFAMLVAPAFDMDLSRAVRDGQPDEAARVVRTATVVSVAASLGVAVAAVLGSWAMLNISLDLPLLPSAVAAMLLYCVAIFYTSIVNKYLLMLGAVASATGWSLARALAGVVILVAFDGDGLVVAVAVYTAVFSLAYGFLVARALRR
ncbi:hypothetical protein [Corynebacterium uterequi]|uniref:Membrane protein involved in the export of O-antigen and teichoic acid n=1 Tax=Corynebacterium uterequi TaxID=1072256 RepID=A0A0G3HIX3_9CORY|nr:hypothetical protein [Corynebacterium uterequi]AKK11888.1 hypothetical protein CUTER_09600 [Corynebacterium uterequi]